MSNLVQKIKQFFQPRAVTIRLPGGGLIISLVVGMAVIITGYGLIKNIKSSTNQSASAEQLPGTPESGARSRITELYDALVAQNKGSDTDVSGLTAAQGDWGAKWNRIKTAALKGYGGGGANNGESYDRHQEFIDGNTGLSWSYPLVRNGNQVTTSPGDYTRWSWDASDTNNRAVGNKTAAQLCQSLGDNWRLPTKNELSGASSYARARNPAVYYNSEYRWSSTEHESYTQGAWYVRWSDGNTHYNNKTYQLLVSCVR